MDSPRTGGGGPHRGVKGKRDFVRRRIVSQKSVISCSVGRKEGLFENKRTLESSVKKDGSYKVESG